MEAKLKSRASAGLLALLSVSWTSLSAQVAPAPAAKDEKAVVLDKFEVKGLRGSLATAADIKQSKLEVVDSIVASDIDKLPDINASYALSYFYRHGL